MKNKIFIKNIPRETTEQVLREFLSKSGIPKNVSIFEEKKFENPNTFALVEMNSEEDAANTIKMFDKSSLGGQTVLVSEANPIPNPKISE